MNANFLIAKNLYGRRLVLAQIVENLLKGQPQGIAPTAIVEQLILLNTLVLNLTKHIHSSNKTPDHVKKLPPNCFPKFN